MFSWFTGNSKKKEKKEEPADDASSSSMFSFASKVAYKKQPSLVTTAAREYDHLFKILTIGDSGVGKSSFILRLCDDSFYQGFMSTIGMDFRIRTVQIGDKIIKLQIWDSSGQERFRTITSSYYRGAHAIALFYDISDRTSFDHLQRWLLECDRYACENISKIIIGSKCDLDSERNVSYEEAEAFAQQAGYPYIEVSSKDNINIINACTTLVSQIAKRLAVDIDVDCVDNVILDAKREIKEQITNADSDEESFDDDDLNAGMDELLSKKKRKKQKKKEGKVAATRHARTNVNISRISMAHLNQSAELLTGDPVLCKKCGVILSSVSKLEPIPKKQSSIPKSPIDSIVLAPPIHPKLEEFTMSEIDYKQGSALWVCEFCGEGNIVDLEPEEIPNSSTVDYVLEPAQSVDDCSDNSNIIFCVDISGSMCVTYEINEKLDLKGMKKREAKNKAISDELGDMGDQYLPGQRRGVTMVSRLQCVQAAIEQKIEKIAQENPAKCVGLISFSNEVTLYGDCSQDQVVVTGDRLYSWDELQRIGKSFQINRPIAEAKDDILAKLWDLEESGPTALGPALQLSIAIAGAKPGSSVVLCTDGLANVGLGSLENNDNEVTPYYIGLAEQAKLDGVTVSVISLIGSECCLEKLSIVADQSAGIVQRVDPTKLTRELAALVDKPVLVYTTMAMIILHRGLLFRGEMDDEEENRYWLVKDLGNVNASTELTISYGFRPKDVCDLTNVSQIPFQVQLIFTRPNGVRYLRISTASISLTNDREKAEKSADYRIIGTHAAQRAAKFAKDGDYEKAQLEARAAQRFMVRNGIEQDKIAKWSNQVEQFDHVVRTERKSKFNKKSNRADATVEALYKGSNLNSSNLF